VRQRKPVPSRPGALPTLFRGRKLQLRPQRRVGTEAHAYLPVGRQIDGAVVVIHPDAVVGNAGTEDPLRAVAIARAQRDGPGTAGASAPPSATLAARNEASQ